MPEGMTDFSGSRRDMEALTESNGSSPGSAAPEAAEPLPAEPSARRRLLWVLGATLLLVVGLGGSVLGGLAWYHYQKTETKRSFDTASAGAASAVGASLNRDLDFISAQASLVAAFPGLTNRELTIWYKGVNVKESYKGVLGFGFVELVSNAQLPAFLAALRADPADGNSAPVSSVTPAGVRSEYCLPRFGIELSSLSFPTLDLCAPYFDGTTKSPIAPMLSQAAADGRTGVTSYRAIAKALSALLGPRESRSLAATFAIAVPVYSGNTTPSTEAGREGALWGWILGNFSSTTLLHAALGSTHLEATLRFASTGEPLTVLGTEGPVPSGPRLVSTTTLTDAPGWSVVITSPNTSGAAVQGLIIGAMGALVVLLLMLFLTHLARSRERALRLVDERTGQLRHQALHDSLTGLPNRALIFDRAQQMLTRARRRPIGIGAIYIDLDNFKDINDTFGHHVGDQLLRSVSNRLATTLRSSDSVGRLGGDEFLVLVEDDSRVAGPEIVAERLHAALTEPFNLEVPEPIQLTVHISMGVAVGQRESADELIRDADVALYSAKDAGRDRFVVFAPEMQAAVKDRLGLEMDLRDAIDGGQLFLVYQPIFDLTTMAAKGAEALVRWQHPTKGVIMPDDFIPLAEETGLIVRLGRYVLNEACAQAAAWQAAGSPIGVAVNISTRQLDSETLIDDVRHALERNGLDPASLSLEINEGALMRDIQRAPKMLGQLKTLGVHVSIDDFGSGYSSLLFLRQFQIDALKIDRSFITRISKTAESTALIHTLIQLGKALGIETLAEGVEDDTQLVGLQREQCDSAQGFLLARPLDAAAIAEFFSSSSIGPPDVDVVPSGSKA
jgi:diguanylate cyclase (GGDEF)-like protein